MDRARSARVRERSASFSERRAAFGNGSTAAKIDVARER